MGVQYVHYVTPDTRSSACRAPSAKGGDVKAKANKYQNNDKGIGGPTGPCDAGAIASQEKGTSTTDSSSKEGDHGNDIDAQTHPAFTARSPKNERGKSRKTMASHEADK